MTKKFAVFGLAFVLILAFSGVASAEHGSGAAGNFPAQNSSACDAHGGTFEQNGSLKSCTVEGGTVYEMTVVAGESGRGWIVEAEVKTVYNLQSSNESESTTTTIIACYNPGGQAKDPNHENCQLH